MTTSQNFIRICVDVDLQGHPVGTSYVVYADGQRISIVVLPCPGPFDTAAEITLDTIAEVQRIFGFHLTMLD